MPIQYSPEAALTLAYLKSTYNDIDIFVEDTSCQNMWIGIIRTCLPPGVKLTSVHMLGGRSNVLSACKHAQASTARPTLFIIDGDFDYILGKAKPNLKHLYRLSAYCVENVLISHHALVRVGFNTLPDKTEQQISVDFGFHAWMDRSVRALKPLFAVYATAHALAPQIKTVGHPVNSLFIHQRRTGPEVCPKKAQKRASTIARQVIREVGFSKFLQEYKAIKKRMRNLGAQKSVSGKDYLLKLCHLRAQAILKFNGNEDQFKTTLASFWDSSTDSHLNRRVRKVLSA